MEITDFETLPPEWQGVIRRLATTLFASQRAHQDLSAAMVEAIGELAGESTNIIKAFEMLRRKTLAPRQDEFDNMSDQEFQVEVEQLVAEALQHAVESQERHIGVYGAQKLFGSDVS